MEENLYSIEQFMLTRDIKKSIGKFHSNSSERNDLSVLFKDLYKKGYISNHVYSILETKMLLHQFCDIMEKKYQPLLCGVFLYDQIEKRIWTAAAPSLRGYCDEIHGISVLDDICKGEDDPDYTWKILNVNDVESANDSVTLTYKELLLRHNLHAYCTIPINLFGHTIGYFIMFSKCTHSFSTKEIRQFVLDGQLIEERLLSMKSLLIMSLKDNFNLV